jgi:hypothetical protein
MNPARAKRRGPFGASAQVRGRLAAAAASRLGQPERLQPTIDRTAPATRRLRYEGPEGRPDFVGLYGLGHGEKDDAPLNGIALDGIQCVPPVVDRDSPGMKVHGGHVSEAGWG